MENLLIIGGGPAGLTAGIYAGRAGLNPVIVESLLPGGQAATTYEVANYPGFPLIGGAELAEKMAEQAEACGAVIEYGEVTAADLSGEIKKITVDGQERLARAVIIATGARKRQLGIPGEKELAGAGVSYCATCDGGFFKGKRLAVIGGGNTALEDALYLADLAEKVYLVHRREEFRGEAALQKRVREKANIELMLSAQPVSVEGSGSVTGLTIERAGKRETLPLDGVFIAVGTVPVTELFAGSLALDGSGYIEAGEDCKTAIPGVFAAGDARRRPIRQIVTACADGATAAQAAVAYLQK